MILGGIKRFSNKMFSPIKRKEFLSEIFVHYWICHQLGSANLIYKCEKWNKEKEAGFVKCMRQNPRQGLTNLDCVISYPFGSFCHPPDNQK